MGKSPESSWWVLFFGLHAGPQGGAEKKQNLRWGSIKPKAAQKYKVMAEDSALATQQHAAGCTPDSLLFCLITSAVFGWRHLN